MELVSIHDLGLLFGGNPVIAHDGVCLRMRLGRRNMTRSKYPVLQGPRKLF